MPITQGIQEPKYIITNELVGVQCDFSIRCCIKHTDDPDLFRQMFLELIQIKVHELLIMTTFLKEPIK